MSIKPIQDACKAALDWLNANNKPIGITVGTMNLLAAAIEYWHNAFSGMFWFNMVIGIFFIYDAFWHPKDFVGRD